MGTYHNANLSNLAGHKYHAINCSVTKDHIEIECLSVVGVGSNHSWQTKIGDQISPLSSSYSVHATTAYERPSVKGVAGTTLLSTRGSEELIIIGDNFGPISDKSCAILK